MKSIASIITLVAVLAGTQSSSSQTRPYAAVLPLPPALRAGATVVRFGRDSLPQLVRQGTNGLVCIDDVPGNSMFDVRRDSRVLGVASLPVSDGGRVWLSGRERRTGGSAAHHAVCDGQRNVLVTRDA